MIHFNHLEIQMNIKLLRIQDWSNTWMLMIYEPLGKIVALLTSSSKKFLIMMKTFFSPIFDDFIKLTFIGLSIYYAASILIIIILNKRKNKSSFRTFQNKKGKKVRCVGRESNPGQLLGRQLCSPLYHRRLRWL